MIYFLIIGFFILLIPISLFFYVRYKFLYFIKHPWKEEIFSCNISEIKKFAKDHSYFSSTRPLIGKVSKDECDIELTQNLLKIIHEKIKDPKRRILITSEVLAKILAYSDLKEKDEVVIPTLDNYGKSIYVHYFVDRVFDIWNKMPAFGLLPKNNKKRVAPILLFRGTDFSLTTKRGWSSIISDLDIGGPGLHAFLNVRPSIHRWLKKAYKITSSKARVIGFSLGGVFTSYTVLFERRWITSDTHQPSVSFNPPGVIKKIYQKWIKLDKEKRPLYLVFINKNDLVPKYGHLFGEIYKLVPKNKLIPPLHAHVTLMTAQKNYQLRPI